MVSGEPGLPVAAAERFAPASIDTMGTSGVSGGVGYPSTPTHFGADKDAAEKALVRDGDVVISGRLEDEEKLRRMLAR